MKARYLVTGCAGLLGVNLVRRLLAKGKDVTSLEIADFKYTGLRRKWISKQFSTTRVSDRKLPAFRNDRPSGCFVCSKFFTSPLSTKLFNIGSHRKENSPRKNTKNA